jgi:toxin-antitoxin system PIN domain toxin
VIAVDTNLLVYAHRSDSEWHAAAARCIEDLANARAPWAIPWPCLHEFLAVVTHPRIFMPPSTLDAALEQVTAWLESPSLVLLTEGPSYFSKLSALLTKGRVVGPRVHDARIAAICAEHEVTELLTADRDFSRFPSVTTRNPLA